MAEPLIGRNDGSAAVRFVAQDAVSYFTSNQMRMDYQACRSQGLQIGSGAIESACKHVILARLK